MHTLDRCDFYVLLQDFNFFLLIKADLRSPPTPNPNSLSASHRGGDAHSGSHLPRDRQALLPTSNTIRSRGTTSSPLPPTSPSFSYTPLPPPRPPALSNASCLSQTFSLFPLLAGRLDPHSPQVHCNDVGADFLQARAGRLLPLPSPPAAPLLPLSRGPPPLRTLGFVVVDIRGRMEPPLGERSFGNLCVYAAASEVDAGDGGAKRRTEEKLRNAIKSIDEEYLRRLRGVEGPLLAFEKGREAAREHGKSDDDVDDIDIYYFNSWARFPVYGVDFGLGKPVWVGVANFFWKNLVLLMGRRGDGGMEAWVTLEEEEMERFEKDEELVSYAASLASIAD